MVRIYLHDSQSATLPVIDNCDELLAAGTDWNLAYEQLRDTLVGVFVTMLIIGIISGSIFAYFWKRGNLRRTFYGLMCVWFHMRIPLAKMAGRQAPYVPDVLIWATEEIEAEERAVIPWLYRVKCTSGDEVKLLRSMLLSWRRPDLTKVRSVHLLTGMIRYFLGNMRERLVPVEYWENMGDRVRTSRSLIPIVMDLPVASRATLAHIMLHLQRLYVRWEQNKLKRSTLGTIMANALIEIPDGCDPQDSEDSERPEKDDRKIDEYKVAIIVSFLSEDLETWEELRQS